jgi:hypothetical protein
LSCKYNNYRNLGMVLRPEGLSVASQSHDPFFLFLFIGLSCILFRYDLPAVLDIDALAGFPCQAAALEIIK